MTQHTLDIALARMGAAERRAAEHRLVRDLRGRSRRRMRAGALRALLTAGRAGGAGDYRGRPRAARPAGGPPRP